MDNFIHLKWMKLCCWELRIGYFMKLRFNCCLILLLCAGFYESTAQQVQDVKVLTRADTLRGSLSSFRICYDINFYDLNVKFDLGKRWIKGDNLFRFTAVHDFSKLQFDLFENLAVDSIIYKGESLAFTREANAVFVSFPEKVQKGQEDEFRVYYSGHPIVSKRAPRDGGIVFAVDTAGRSFVATACEGTGASVWWPNKDHLSDEVDSMRISITVPDDVKNVSNGRLISVNKLSDGFTRYNWFVSNPINNYNVAANIGAFVHLKDVYQGEGGRLDLDYWVLPEHQGMAALQFGKSVKQMLRAFEYWFGPYPFYKDGYKIVEVPYPAMEHQSAIAYGGFLPGFPPNEMVAKEGGEVWDFIIVHESAHEWFGNSITAKDLADLWIHESFGTYAESLFIEFLYGKEAGQNYVRKNKVGLKNDAAIVAPYGVNKMGSGEMYGKGALLLNMIRTIVDDDVRWRGILRGLNAEFRHKTVSYNDIVNYISMESGKDLKPVFDQYLLFKELPKLEFIMRDGMLNCRWKADIKGFKMPVRLKRKDGAYTWITPGSEFTPVRVKGLTLKNMEVDMDNFLIGS